MDRVVASLQRAATPRPPRVRHQISFYLDENSVMDLEAFVSCIPSRSSAEQAAGPTNGTLVRSFRTGVPLV